MGNIHQSKFNDSLKITSIIVSKFDQSIPESIKKGFICPPFKPLYKKKGKLYWLGSFHKDARFLN